MFNPFDNWRTQKNEPPLVTSRGIHKFINTLLVLMVIAALWMLCFLYSVFSPHVKDSGRSSVQQMQKTVPPTDDTVVITTMMSS
jgi:hypothetical protein